jgi:DNA repair protein SbcC/Rad50
LQAKLEEYQTQQAKLNTDIADAHENENKLSHNITRIQTEYEAICNKLDNFEKASHQPICELCGQEITPEHAQAEKLRLNAQIADVKANLTSLKNEHHQAQENINVFSKELDNFNEKIRDINNNCSENRNQLSQAQRDAKQYTEAIYTAFSNLPVTYQVNVYPYVIDNDLCWLDTSYPTSSDLEELNRLLSNRQAQAQKLNKLRNQISKWQDTI